MVPKGNYVSGTVFLKSNVELHLSRGAELQGSLNVFEDFSERSFICAINQENISITGPGCINGRSDSEFYRQQFAEGTFKNNDPYRPFGIYLEDCKNVVAKDFSLKNAGFWSFRLFRCDVVSIDGLKITSLHCVNNDGIDVDARNVNIRNCIIRSDDDGICLKSNDSDFPVENILVENCAISSNCNPIKFGTASLSCFRNVTFRNCKITSTGEAHVWDWSTKYHGLEPWEPLGLSGITVQSADGAIIENILFENISMEGIMTPVFLYVGHRSSRLGSIRNVRFEHITASARGHLPSIISGHRESAIDGISIRDMKVVADGCPENDFKPRENETGYPENRMFGKENPAGAFYVRHAQNIDIQDFNITYRTPDGRPSVVCDDTFNIKLNNEKYGN